MTGPMFVSYGGGVNSTAMLIGMHERGIVPDAVQFSDTKGEKPETYFYARVVLAGWLSRAGFPPLTELCRTDRLHLDESLEAECHRLGTLPSRAYGFGTCADKWKLDPMRWWVKKRYGGQQVIRAVGFDAGEPERAKPYSDKHMVVWYPLIEWGWDRDACVAAIKRAGLPVPPKSACFFCPSSKKREVIQLGKRHPALLARAFAIEDSGMAKASDAKGLGRSFSWRALIAADAAQQKLFPESPVEDCLICVDESEAA